MNSGSHEAYQLKKEEEVVAFLKAAIEDVIASEDMENLDSASDALIKLKAFDPMIELVIYNKLNEIPGILINTEDKYFNTKMLIEKLNSNMPVNDKHNQIAHLAHKLYITVFLKVDQLMLIQKYKKERMDRFFYRAVERLEALRGAQTTLRE